MGNCKPTVITPDRRGKTVVNDMGPKRITLSRNTVARIEQNRPKVVTKSAQQRVDVVEQPTIAKVGTNLGPPGPRGAPGGSIPAIEFAFGDAPRVVFTPDAAGLLTYARVKYTEVFNGANPQLFAGTLADPDAAMPAAFNDPRSLEEYEYTPDIRLATGESIILTIVPGAGASAGAGILILGFLPD